MSAAGLTAGVFRIGFSDTAVTAGFSGRNYDNSRRGEFLAELGLNIRDLVMVEQVHGSAVVVVRKPDPALADAPADGLITSVPGIVLGIRTADCVPVFFCDPVHKAVGIVHGGWRGVKAGIISRILNTFEREFGTDLGDLEIAIGPSIRKCCYEVEKEFLGHFPGFYHAKDAAKGRLDLVGVIRARMVKRGVREAKIHDTGLCTVCENKKFFSYRAENRILERVLSVISVRSKGGERNLLKNGGRSEVP